MTSGNGEARDVTPEMQSEALSLYRAAAGSVMMERLQWMRQAGISFNGARDMYSVLGYNRILTIKEFRDRYARGGLAGRVVDVMPDATWRGQPAFDIVEDKDGAKDTDFERTWKILDQRLQISAKLLRVDKMSRLSTYAVLLIGVEGESGLETELPQGRPDGLLYLTPFTGGGGPGDDSTNRSMAANADCSIYEFDADPRSVRFGQPLSYQLRRTSLNSPLLQVPVHWSRIIHVAEGVLEDDVYGQPALERVWNLLDDLDKVTGGGAEAFWLRANQGLHINVEKDMQFSSPEAAAAALTNLKDKSEDYKHQLTRWLQTRGVEVKTLGSDVANFQQPADSIITQIAGAKAIPKRILTGSEMGELASSQDRENFKDQVNGRQSQYAGPYIVRRLVDRLIQYGYLPTPTKGEHVYEVKWPHIQTLTEQEKAEGAAKWAAVNAAAGFTVFTAAEIRDKWYGLAASSDNDVSHEPWRAELALKMATANQTQGATIFTDDEIRKTCYDWKPLSDAQKDPIAAPTRSYKEAPGPRAAKPEPDVELVSVLAAALESRNGAVVSELLGLGPTSEGDDA